MSLVAFNTLQHGIFNKKTGIVPATPTSLGAIMWYVGGDTTDRITGQTLLISGGTTGVVNGFTSWRPTNGSSYIVSPNNSGSTSNSWTISMAFYIVNTPTANAYLFGQCNSAAIPGTPSVAQAFYYDFATTSPKLKCNIGDAYALSMTDKAINSWDQCVVSLVCTNGTSTKLYFNDFVNFTFTSYTYATSFSVPNATGSFRIGSLSGNSTYPTSTNYYFRAAAFFPTALTSSEVQSLTMNSICGK